MSDIKSKIEEFNKRWEIISNSDYQEEFKNFRVRVLNLFRNIDNELREQEVKYFCNVVAVSYNGRSHPNVYRVLESADQEKVFYKILQILCLIPVAVQRSSRTRQVKFSRKMIFNRIVSAVELSNVNLAITIAGDDLILFPRGEKIFDGKLVDEVVTFLNPESQTHFVDALRFYEKPNGVKSAESLRRTLEEFLRFKLKNGKGLDNNITELQRKLKGDKRDPQVRNIIFSTFKFLDQYFNENSKHKDGDINETENEYLIYQIGVLIRYIDRCISI